MQKKLVEGQRIPRGYGLSYYDVDYGVAVFYIWPLNWLVAWGRQLWYRLRDTDYRQLTQAYSAGKLAGRAEANADWQRMTTSLLRKYDERKD